MIRRHKMPARVLVSSVLVRGTPQARRKRTMSELGIAIVRGRLEQEREREQAKRAERAARRAQS